MAGLSQRARRLLAGAAVGGAVAVGAPIAAATPNLDAPPAGAVTGDTPTFAWTDPSPIAGLDHWDIRVDGATIGTVTPSGPATDPQSFTPGGAIASGAHTWQVVGVDGAATEDPSPARSITIDGLAPDTPAIEEPEDEDETNNPRPTFEWDSVADNGAAGVSHYVVTRNGVPVSPQIPQPGGGAGVQMSWARLPAEAPLPDGDDDYRVVAVDNVGNTATSAAIDLIIDTVPPTITGAPTTGAPPSGWYTGDVVIDFFCTDALSGIASCPPDATITEEGEGLTRSGTAFDQAGNSAGTTSAPPVKIDKSPPAESVLQTPSPGAVTNDSTPTLVWDPASDNGPSGLAGYELILDGDTIGLPALVESYTPPGALPSGTHSWQVDTIDVAGNRTPGTSRSFTVDPNAVGGPTITGGPANPTNATSHGFTWTGLPGATFSWEFRRGAAKLASNPGTTSTSATLPSAGDDTYTFVIKQKTNGVFGAETAYAFRVDTIAPAQPVLVGLPPDSSTDNTPGFSWIGEPLGLYNWQVVKDSVVVQQGNSLANQISTSPLAPGTYAFRVRQVDDAGNVGPFSPVDMFSVVAPTVPGSAESPVTTQNASKSSTSTTRPAVANTRRLKPKVGAVLTTLRPTLRWNRRAGATIYNVQIFELNGTKFRKVLSRFPVRNSFRVPAGTLKHGRRYVWRVWPFLGPSRSAASKPVGVSFFDVRRPKLNALLAKRLIAPKAARLKKARKLTVRWKDRRGSRYYRVELRRNKKVVVRNGERVVTQRAKLLYRRTTRTRRVVIPAKHLRVKGSYTLVVRASRGKLRNRYHRVTWARGTVRRI